MGFNIKSTIIKHKRELTIAPPAIRFAPTPASTVIMGTMEYIRERHVISLSPALDFIYHFPFICHSVMNSMVVHLLQASDSPVVWG